MTSLPFGRYFVNTASMTFGALVGQLSSCSLVAFAFARLRWSGRHVLFLIVLSTMMLPAQVTLIPKFLIFKYLGLGEQLCADGGASRSSAEGRS